MNGLIRSSLVALIAVAALALPTAATAAPASTTFSVVGYEYAFTQTVGNFAGTAVGNAGDSGFWNASVQHDPLGTQPTTYVNGGTFQLVTRSGDFVTGTFAYHGGEIRTLDPGLGCTNQRYLVTGTLENVTTTTTTGGTGSFSAVLTHYRAFIFGRCVIYAARVVGTVTFAY
jgi:hypothetical protein